MVFPFLQTMITDFKEVGEEEKSQEINDKLVKSAEAVFGTDSIFYLGYTFDYYATMMTKNFNLGYQKINKLLPTIKKTLPCKPEDSVILTLIEAYIEFSKITIGINP